MSKFNSQKSKQEYKLPRKDKKTRNSRKRKKRAKKRKAILRKTKRQQESITEIVTEDSQSLTTIMSGDCYWKNYMSVFNWQQHCLNHYNNQSQTYKSQTSLNNWNEWRGQVEYERFADEEKISNIPEPNSSSDDDEPSDLTFVIPDEMLEFMEIHMRHKEEMRLKREKELSNQNLQPGQRSISERDNIEECLAPQEKSVNVKRIEEMNELYGSSAPMIMGMETSIQLNFNRNRDIYKPSYWPILPFTFKFS